MRCVQLPESLVVHSTYARESEYVTRKREVFGQVKANIQKTKQGTKKPELEIR